MSLPLIIRPAAEPDLAAARDWYDAQRPGLGLDFKAAVEDVFARIRAAPEIFAAEYRGVRRAGLRRFPYVVYYRLTSAAVEVLAVLHGGRDPRSWRSRA
jgi:plasmid stabilization system protein ParE